MKTNLELLLTRYTPFIDELSSSYHYLDNIKHLLYLIVPAFMVKYGYEREHLILDCFKNIPIVITGKEDPIKQAYYQSVPYLSSDGYKTDKKIFLNRYENIPLMVLIDNLVHEMNHAINSYQKEINITEDYLYLRTGLTNIIYYKNNLAPYKKEDSYILEEIINTEQTEEIITIMASFNLEDIKDRSLQNTLYAIQKEIDGTYTSGAYYLPTQLSKPLLTNKTFKSTLENLRINGEIQDIPSWFNAIYGKDDGYETFIELLLKMITLLRKEQNHHFSLFRKRKIKNLVMELRKIENQFINNCTYK